MPAATVNGDPAIRNGGIRLQKQMDTYIARIDGHAGWADQLQLIRKNIDGAGTTLHYCN